MSRLPTMFSAGVVTAAVNTTDGPPMVFEAFRDVLRLANIYFITAGCISRKDVYAPVSGPTFLASDSAFNGVIAGVQNIYPPLHICVLGALSSFVERQYQVERLFDAWGLGSSYSEPNLYLMFTTSPGGYLSFLNEPPAVSKFTKIFIYPSFLFFQEDTVTISEST